MGIEVIKEVCVGPLGCKLCVIVCPADCMRIGEDGYPYLHYPNECWNCGACELDCHKEAIFTALDWHLV